MNRDKTLLKELQAFNAVAAGSVANTVAPSNGPTYLAFFIEYKSGGTLANDATMKADLTNIQVKLNGDSIFNLSATEAIMLADFYGYTRDDGYLPIYFNRPEFGQRVEQDNFSLGTKGVQNLSVEVTIDGAATSPALRLFADVEDAGPRPVGQLIRIRSTNLGSAIAAGTHEITDLPITGPGRGLKALHIARSDIDEHEIEITKGNVSKVINEAPAELQALFHDMKSYATSGRAAQSGYYHIDVAGNRFGAIRGMDLDEFRLKLEVTGSAAALKIIHEEVIGRPDQAA
jgi:hypothetical protein